MAAPREMPTHGRHVQPDVTKMTQYSDLQINSVNTLYSKVLDIVNSINNILHTMFRWSVTVPSSGDRLPLQ